MNNGGHHEEESKNVFPTPVPVRGGHISAMDDQRKNPAKVFVGGLGQGTTDLTLKAYFSLYGTVEDAVVVVDKITNRSRGFGFCTFLSTEASERCLAAKHRIDSVSCEVRTAVPRDEARGTAPYDTVDQPGKLFVGGLPEDVTEDRMREYFEQYGRVRQATLMYDKNNHRPRGFGFIVFEDKSNVNKALGLHTQLGRSCEAKKAEPRPDAIYGRRTVERYGRGDGPDRYEGHQDSQWSDRNGSGSHMRWHDNGSWYGGRYGSSMGHRYVHDIPHDDMMDVGDYRRGRYSGHGYAPPPNAAPIVGRQYAPPHRSNDYYDPSYCCDGYSSASSPHYNYRMYGQGYDTPPHAHHSHSSQQSAVGVSSVQPLYQSHNGPVPTHGQIYSGGHPQHSQSAQASSASQQQIHGQSGYYSGVPSQTHYCSSDPQSQLSSIPHNISQYQSTSHHQPQHPNSSISLHYPIQSVPPSGHSHSSTPISSSHGGSRGQQFAPHRSTPRVDVMRATPY